MSADRSRLGLIHRCSRATVAIYIALLAPVLAGAVALGVEVTSWSTVQAELQRTADASARAGAIYCYNYTANATPAGSTSCLSTTTTGQAAAQAAATVAARLAEVNGATGTSAPAWNATTDTYSDNKITAQIVDGVKSSSDAAVQVSVQQTVPLTISRIFNSTPSLTLSASSISEVESSSNTSETPGSGGQPCMVALETLPNGGSGITITGSITVNAPGCTIVSNSNYNNSGGETYTLSGIYAAGTITTSSAGTLTIPCWATINGNNNDNGCTPYPPSGMLQSNPYVHPGSVVLPDPYASDTSLQTVLTDASNTAGTVGASSISCPQASTSGLYNGSNGCNMPGSSGSTYNGSYCTGQGTSGPITCYLKPGTYGGLTVTGGGPWVFNMASGSYTFTGNIAVSGATNTFDLQPGNYRGLAVTGGSASICMAPGEYVFNGNINLTNWTFTADRSTTVNGSSITCPSTDTGGVTVITTGTFTGNNTWMYSMSAPDAAQAASTGGIAGVVLAGTTTGSVILTGSEFFYVTGVVYFPNASFEVENSNNLGTSGTTCLEIIAATISLSGNTDLSSGCSSVNALSFTSQPGTSTTTYSYKTALVQ
jgi:hypothetical protein